MFRQFQAQRSVRTVIMFLLTPSTLYTSMVDESLKERFEKERERERHKAAGKSPLIAALLGFVLPPAGYLYTEQYRFLLLNLLTVNYLMFGNFIVPIHCYISITNANNEVQRSQTTTPSDDQQQEIDPEDAERFGLDEDRF